MAKQGNSTPSTDAIVAARDALVVELESTDKQLVEVTGTQSKRLADASAWAEGVEATWMMEDVVLSGSIFDQKQSLDNLLADYTQFHKELVDAHMQEQRGATKEPRDVLVEARKTLVKQIEAFNTTLTLLDPSIDEYKVPRQPGSRGGGGASGTMPNAAFQFYTILKHDGKRRDQSGHQNSISSINYYHGRKLLNSDAEKTTTEQLRAAISSKGQNPDVKGSSWQVELPGGIVGLDVISMDNEEDA